MSVRILRSLRTYLRTNKAFLSDKEISELRKEIEYLENRIVAGKLLLFLAEIVTIAFLFWVFAASIILIG